MLAICLVILVLSAPILWLLYPYLPQKIVGWLATLPPLTVTAYLFTQIDAVAHGYIFYETYLWASELHLSLALRLDGLSLFFGLIIVGIGSAVALYTAGYLENNPRQGYFYSILFLFMTSMLGLVLADNLLTLFSFWELTTVTSYLLVGFNGNSDEAQKGARQALVITSFGGLALLGGLILLGQAAGTYTISELLTIPDLTTHAGYPTALTLILLGAFTKSAQFPFHFWLPGAMAAPTPASAYLHSATMVKAGIFLLARLHPALSHSPLWFWSLLIFGGLTMILGAATALRFHDLKRILAYATISLLGMLVMLLAFEGKYAYLAVLVGILAHALYKGPLFMIAGIIDHATGTRDIRRLSGLWSSMPAVGVVTLLAACSMAGFPPLMGFVAKEAALETLHHYADHDLLWLGWLGLGMIALTGALYVAYSMKLIWEPFFRQQPVSKPAHVHHAPSFTFILPPLVLVLIGTILPFMLPTLDPLLSAAASSIAGETIHVHAAIWHGFTIPLLMSTLAIAGGIAIFWVRQPIQDALARLPAGFDGALNFQKIYDGSFAATEWITHRIQSTTLSAQSSIVLLSAVALVAYALSHLNIADLGIQWDDVPPFYEVIISLLAIISAIVTVRAATRLNAIISIGVVGITVTLIFINYAAPDLALTQLVIDILTVILLILVFYRIPPDELPSRTWLLHIRNWTISILVGLSGFVMVLVGASDPFAPSISDYFSLNAIPGGHGANIVNVILVDFRAYDTLGEITVLAIAAVGGYGLLRASRLRAEKE